MVPYEELALPEDYEDADATLTEQQQRLRIDMVEVPERVVFGEDLRYVVELTNDSDVPVFMEPCPVYYQAFGESGFAISRTSYLNCDDAPPEIPPGDAVRFEMKLPVDDPEALHVDSSLIWYLGAPDGDLRTDVYVGGEVEVVPAP